MHPIKILLIDDDENYFKLIQKMLALHPKEYSLDWASNYKLAKSVVGKTRHDVYLVDYWLDDEHNGFELLREMQASGIHGPFILLTGNSDPNFEEKALQAGVSDYLEKTDLKPELLMRTIRFAMHRQTTGQPQATREIDYQILVQQSSDGIFVTDLDGKITLANAAACTMLDCPVEALKGQLITEYVRPTKPGQKFELEMIPDVQALIDDYRLRLPEGGKLPVEVSAKRVGEAQFLFTLRDITHRKEAEAARDSYIQRLMILHQVDQELNDQLNVEYVLALALDAAVRLSAANAGFIGTLENSQIRIAQAIGKYSQFQPGDFLPRTGAFRRVLDDQQARLIMDVNSDPDYIATIPETRAQMIIPLLSYERMLGVLNLETNRPERFTEDVFDFLKLITVRIAVAIENSQLYAISQEQLARLQELYSQVSELEKLKTDMIRIAAHDLRNPVGVIVGYLELLEWSLEDQLTAKQHHQIEAMARAAHRMEKITTDILSLERIEKLHLDQTHRIELNPVVNEAFEEYESQAGEKRQTLELHLTDEKLNVQADHAQIREAISNLISNAIKYTPNGGVIKVTLRREKSFAIFLVEDNGYGIQEDQQASLFQPFYRASSEETVGIDGTGLGLHLVKNIITRHEGEMIFESVYGEGSTFGFSLPLS